MHAEVVLISTAWDGPDERNQKMIRPHQSAAAISADCVHELAAAHRKVGI